MPTKKLGTGPAKAIHVDYIVNESVERLANSRGDKDKNRMKFFNEDTKNRYAIPYEIISGQNQTKEGEVYHINNPLKARYWAPLKIEEGGREKWVLVNKASLHKRFGLSYENIDESAGKGTLSASIAAKVKELEASFSSVDKIYRGEFITEGADSEDFFGGVVKDRFKLIKDDLDNRYAIPYKAIANQPEKGLNPEFSSLELRYWVPYMITNRDGSNTWILLNKSSLCKRFNNIKAEDLNYNEGLTKYLDGKIADKQKEVEKKIESECKIFIENSAIIFESMKTYRKKFDDFKSNPQTTTVRYIYQDFIKEIKEPLTKISKLETKQLKSQLTDSDLDMIFYDYDVESLRRARGLFDRIEESLKKSNECILIEQYKKAHKLSVTL